MRIYNSYSIPYFYQPHWGINCDAPSPITKKTSMVILKSHKAMGSFLGRGTHVWLEIHPSVGNKVTFSGAKVTMRLGIAENLKKDYHKLATRGSVVVSPPAGMSSSEWADRVIGAGRDVKLTLHKKLKFNGTFPFLSGHGNCCTIVNMIVDRAGGKLPPFNPSGFAPGLGSPPPNKRSQNSLSQTP